MAIEQINLTISAGEELDLSVTAFTDPIEILRSYKGWSLLFEFFDSPDADPIIEIQGSSDDIEYTKVYSRVIDPEVGDVEDIRILLTKAFSDTSEGINSVSNSKFVFKFFRIAIDPNGGTQGNMTGILSLFTD